MTDREILWSLKCLMIMLGIAMLYIVVIVVMMFTGHEVPSWANTVISLIAAAGLIASQVPTLWRILRDKEDT